MFAITNSLISLRANGHQEAKAKSYLFRIVQNVPVNCFTLGRCATLRGEAAHWDTLYFDFTNVRFARKIS